ncbi:MAG: hypothetical protein II817_07230 [Bacteroidales bacterium]|nr:hypothetical protein [Bacteroidales bacterium]
MDLTEIINEALKLPQKDKTRLINAVLESMNGKQSDGFVYPVFRALEDFKARYMEYKGTDYTGTKADFRWMKQLLEQIHQKTIEGQKEDTVVITPDTLISNLNAFLKAVKQLKNTWYFDNRFTPEGLAKDFEKIYGNLKQNNSYERAKRACDYL